MTTYRLIDSGNQKKLEYFGNYCLIRPCSQAVWEPSLFFKDWEKAHAQFSREEKEGWTGQLPNHWVTEWDGLKFKVTPTDFGHLGMFPEHRLLWEWASLLVKKQQKKCAVLNLFAYSGGATLALARAGAEVCHLDASFGMVQWARENAALNSLQGHPIRWIVDDVIKFLKREIRRGRKYEGILLDPPSFGRGAQGEVFKIERDIGELLRLSKELLSEEPLFIALSTHTSGMTPLVLQNVLASFFPEANVEVGEMALKAETGKDLPCGAYGRICLCP